MNKIKKLHNLRNMSIATAIFGVLAAILLIVVGGVTVAPNASGDTIGYIFNSFLFGYHAKNVGDIFASIFIYGSIIAAETLFIFIAVKRTYRSIIGVVAFLGMAIIGIFTIGVIAISWSAISSSIVGLVIMIAAIVFTVLGYICGLDAMITGALYYRVLAKKADAELVERNKAKANINVVSLSSLKKEVTRRRTFKDYFKENVISFVSVITIVVASVIILVCMVIPTISVPIFTYVDGVAPAGQVDWINHTVSVTESGIQLSLFQVAFGIKGTNITGWIGLTIALLVVVLILAPSTIIKWKGRRWIIGGMAIIVAFCGLVVMFTKGLYTYSQWDVFYQHFPQRPTDNALAQIWSAQYLVVKNACAAIPVHFGTYLISILYFAFAGGLLAISLTDAHLMYLDRLHDKTNDTNKAALQNAATHK